MNGRLYARTKATESLQCLANSIQFCSQHATLPYTDNTEIRSYTPASQLSFCFHLLCYYARPLRAKHKPCPRTLRNKPHTDCSQFVMSLFAANVSESTV